MSELSVYSYVAYEMYLNQEVDLNDINPVDKLLNALNKQEAYCLASHNPFDKELIFHLEGVFDSKEEAIQKISYIKANTNLEPMVTRYDIVHEKLNLPSNKANITIPHKSELWPEPNYLKMKRWNTNIDKLFWMKVVYDSLPERPISRCGYDAYIKFITDLKKEIETSSSFFNIGEWMVSKGYATGPYQVYPDDNSKCICYEINEEVLNGTGIIVPNIPNTSEGLILDAEASHFLGLKDKGIVLPNGPITSLKVKLQDIRKFTKNFNISIFGGEKQTSTKSETSSHSENHRKGPKL